MFPGYLPKKNTRTGLDAPIDNDGRAALHHAVLRGDIPETERLIRSGADPAVADYRGMTPLFYAVADKNVGMIECLLHNGARINALDSDDKTPFDRAVMAGADIDFLERLLAGGARADWPKSDNSTILHLAADHNRSDLIAYFLSKGASINAKDDDGNTPLHRAIMNEDTSAVSALLDAGADASIRNNELETPLHLAATEGLESIAALLLTQASVVACLNTARTMDDGLSPLLTAVSEGHAAIVRRLLDAGADINQTDHEKRNALFIAVEEGHIDVVRLLLDRGAASAFTAGADTALRQDIIHVIHEKNHDDILLLLHDAGINTDMPGAKGRTPLHEACRAFDAEKAEALLVLGSDPNRLDSFGFRPIDLILGNPYPRAEKTAEIIALLLHYNADPGMVPELLSARRQLSSPLHVTAQLGLEDSVRALIAANAPLNETARSSEKQTAFLIAAEHGRLNVLKLLHDAGADVSRVSSTGKTALHYAAKNGSSAVLAFLTDTAALDIDMKDNDGDTPLHLAARGGRHDAVQFLLESGASMQVRNHKGYTPLHDIATDGNARVAALFTALSPAPADWNTPSAVTKETPLHLAAQRNFVQLIAFLLDHGADVTRQDSQGHTPLQRALETKCLSSVVQLTDHMVKNNIPVPAVSDGSLPLIYIAAAQVSPKFLEALHKAGAPIGGMDDAGNTALHVAVAAGYLENVAFLLTAGTPDMRIKNKAGLTALDLARQTKKDAIVRLLEEAQSRTVSSLSQAAKNWKPDGPK